MSDLEKAKSILESGYTCVLCKGNTVYTSVKKGISPMVDFLDNGTDMKGFSAADKIIGKAAAMLFALAGVQMLYAEVITREACAVLEDNRIEYSYKTLTDNIINRSGSGLCPMEQAVYDITDINEGYLAVKEMLAMLSGDNN